MTGVEGVPYVVEQFFRENKLDYEKAWVPKVRGWKFNVRMSFKTFIIIYLTISFFRRKITGCASLLAISSASPPR